jgi:hypothetical protein
MNKVFRAAVFVAWQVAGWAAPLTIVCSVDIPVVQPGQVAVATMLTDVPVSNGPRYLWKATGGKLSGVDQSTAKWSPDGAAPGPYNLSGSVTSSDGSSGSCSVVVFAGREARGGNPTASRPAGPMRQIRSAMLQSGKIEADHFGLYSYMLLGSKPNPSNQERYVTFLKAFTDTVVAYDRLNEQLPPAQLNIAYIPVRDDPPPNFKVEEWLLDHYDYDGAKRILEKIPGAQVGDGPFIVSSDRPLSTAVKAPDRYLFEDLSTVPVPIIKFWVNQFRIQTAQERWDHATLSGVAVRIRTALEIAAIAYPEIRGSIATLLKGN